jgi:hypothetical protein
MLSITKLLAKAKRATPKGKKKTAKRGKAEVEFRTKEGKKVSFTPKGKKKRRASAQLTPYQRHVRHYMKSRGVVKGTAPWIVRPMMQAAAQQWRRKQAQLVIVKKKRRAA